MKTQSQTANEILAQSGVRNPSFIFQEAFREQSNRELDWLWYAEWVSSDAERRYCLQRALYINPGNRKANKELDALSRKQVAGTQPTHTFSLGRLLHTTLFSLVRREAHPMASE